MKWVSESTVSGRCCLGECKLQSKAARAGDKEDRSRERGRLKMEDVVGQGDGDDQQRERGVKWMAQ